MEMLKPGPELDAQIASAGVGITHFFVGDQYAKLTRIPAGAKLHQHTHNFTHDAMLLIGVVEFGILGRDRKVYVAPCRIQVPADTPHGLTAITEVLWACLWANPTGETDPDEFDHKVIKQ